VNKFKFLGYAMSYEEVTDLKQKIKNLITLMVR
jgi:hypothetical protein